MPIYTFILSAYMLIFHYFKPIVLNTTTTYIPQKCGDVSALVSQRDPIKPIKIKTGTIVWAFARMGGIKFNACSPGQLTFLAQRRAVFNTPSRWELYLNSSLLQSGLVTTTLDEPAQEINIYIPKPGRVALIFSNANAYSDLDKVYNRRTIYFSKINFHPKLSEKKE